DSSALHPRTNEVRDFFWRVDAHHMNVRREAHADGRVKGKGKSEGTFGALWDFAGRQMIGRGASRWSGGGIGVVPVLRLAGWLTAEGSRCEQEDQSMMSAHAFTVVAIRGKGTCMLTRVADGGAPVPPNGFPTPKESWNVLGVIELKPVELPPSSAEVLAI